jgi:hypothetical protein
MGKPTGAHVSGPLQPLVRGFLFELIEVGTDSRRTDSAAAADGRAEFLDGRAGHRARGSDPVVGGVVSGGRPRSGAGEAVVLADIRAATAGVFAWAGPGACAGGGGGDRSGRPPGGRVRRVPGAGAGPDGRDALCL